MNPCLVCMDKYIVVVVDCAGWAGLIANFPHPMINCAVFASQHSGLRGFCIFSIAQFLQLFNCAVFAILHPILRVFGIFF